MALFLKRLAIFLSAPAAVLALLSIYWNATDQTGRRPDYFAAGLLFVWCALVWGLYWVLLPLTRPRAPK